MSLRHLVLAACLAAPFAAHAQAHGELVGPGVISTGLQETSAAVTPDGDTLYFMRSDFAEQDDTILVSHRADGHWGTPQVASFSGQWHDSEPTLSPDGRRLYFVSNRPVQSGGAPVTAAMDGHRFTGTNLWYVQRQPDGHWGAPVHVDGALNDGAMIYNPSVAADGDIYFSAHRADSGPAYQIYVARRTAQGYATPQRVELGDVAHNRMDPAIDPQQRFLVYAGNEGDSLGSADIYIAFREADGRWGKPLHLSGEVNSPSLENAPSLGPHFGELYVSSNRRDEVAFPKPRDTAATLQQRLQEPLNGSRNLWRFDIADVLRAHGIER
ncbi:PD40 domain-containing protein [Rhodanobacter sp. DHB23]|uniref:PD40 domain-containing protein n=1 Tax=Rhodanobacter sp. DHB23 TaxID=2775923 RepID=UPI0017819DE6|nr:PD40 domain-containing protein [Rhodanobacter sp. DHB23]MBD8874603.1 PD40 domain-containing protein [Rhodanobacter sp. DHB23]